VMCMVRLQALHYHAHAPSFTDRNMLPEAALDRVRGDSRRTAQTACGGGGCGLGWLVRTLLELLPAPRLPPRRLLTRRGCGAGEPRRRYARLAAR
jgi:hypothetical protein